MRFSIKHLFAGMILVSAFMMYTILDGIGVAAIFAILAFFVFFTIYRLRKNWKNLRTAGRTYGIVITIGATFLMAGFIFLTSTDASVSRNRTSRLLQRSLASDPGFSDIQITYEERKIEYIYVTGTLENIEDLDPLKTRILNNNWRGMDAIRWDLSIRDTGEKIVELDYDYALSTD